MQERLFMTARLSRLAVPTGDLPVEVVEDALLPELGVVMASAYAGTTDDEGGSDSEALEELNNASRGEYGEPIRNCWLVTRVDSILAGAVICTRSEGRPLIAFVFTDLAFTGRGIARQLILEIGGRLRAAGDHEVTLWVTATNPAARIYKSLGFDIERSVTA